MRITISQLSSEKVPGASRCIASKLRAFSASVEKGLCVSQGNSVSLRIVFSQVYIVTPRPVATSYEEVVIEAYFKPIVSLIKFD